jgi:hypothetical protein
MSFVMTDPHKRDNSWETDLIWKYFHLVTTEAPPQGAWYKGMDPLGELSNRHRVYELLVNEADHTNPKTPDEVGKSMIPWNQNNKGILKTCSGKEICGTSIKLVFARYMKGWTLGKEPVAISVTKKGFDATKWTIDKLQSEIPVRLGLRMKHGGTHYVGIVGHRCRKKPLPPSPDGKLECSADNEFLCLEPWAGGVDANASIIYAGTETAFLGIIQQSGSTWTYGTTTGSSVEA